MDGFGYLEWARERLEHDDSIRVLLDAVFFNATPALVGGWRGDAHGVEVLGGRLLYPEPPRPTDIAGKLRWWARVAILSLAAARGAHPLPSYADAERVVSLLFGCAKCRYGGEDAVFASPLRVRVEPLAVAAVDSAVTLYARGGRCGGRARGPVVDPEALLREAVSRGSPWVEPVGLDYRGWACSAPRSNVSADVHEGRFNLPLPPGSYVFRLRVELDTLLLEHLLYYYKPTSGFARSHGLDEEFLAGLAEVSLTALLAVHGIGRGVNRGYGRLGVLEVNGDEYTMHNPLGVLYEKLESLACHEVVVRLAAGNGSSGTGTTYYIDLNMLRSMACGDTPVLELENLGQTWSLLEAYQNVYGEVPVPVCAERLKSPLRLAWLKLPVYTGASTRLKLTILPLSIAVNGRPVRPSCPDPRFLIAERLALQLRARGVRGVVLRAP